jgi:predicted nucleic acid-binding Zn ribbon protein
MREPTPIGDILRARLAGLGISRQISEAKAEHLWPELVGGEIAAHTRVVRVEKGRLLVAVDSATWRHELTFQKQALLDKLNDGLRREGGGRILTEIIFTGP